MWKWQKKIILTGFLSIPVLPKALNSRHLLILKPHDFSVQFNKNTIGRTIWRIEIHGNQGHTHGQIHTCAHTTCMYTYTPTHAQLKLDMCLITHYDFHGWITGGLIFRLPKESEDDSNGIYWRWKQRWPPTFVWEKNIWADLRIQALF